MLFALLSAASGVLTMRIQLTRPYENKFSTGVHLIRRPPLWAVNRSNLEEKLMNENEQWNRKVHRHFQ